MTIVSFIVLFLPTTIVATKQTNIQVSYTTEANVKCDFINTCRNMLAFVYISVLQKELDVFQTTIWNNHCSRYQRGKELPVGIPEHINNFPESYGGENCGLPVPEEELREVAELSNVLGGTDDFLSTSFRQECECHIEHVDAVKPSEAAMHIYVSKKILT